MADIQTNSQQTFDPNPSRLELNAENFMFAVSINQNSSYPFITRPFFNITITQRTNSRLDDGNITRIYQPLIMEQCRLDKFQRVFNRYGYNFTTQYQTVGFDTFLCPLDNYSIILEGTYTSKNFSFVQIQVTPCQNQTSNYSSWNPVCPFDNNQLGTLQVINLYQTNYIVNPDQPNDYIQPYLSDQLNFRFSPQTIFKTVNIFYQNYEILSDQNIILGNSISQENIYLNEYGDFQEQVDVPNSYVYSQFFMRRSYFTKQIQRSALKLQDLISFLGGFAGLIFPFFGLFLNHYNKLQFLLSLANKTYNFDQSNSIVHSMTFSENNETPYLSSSLNNQRQSQNRRRVQDSQRDRTARASILSNTQVTSPNRQQKDDFEQILDDITLNNPPTNKSIATLQDNDAEQTDNPYNARVRTMKIRKSILQIVKTYQPLKFCVRWIIHHIFPFECLRNTTVKRINQAMQVISKDMDIISVIKVSQDVEKLKQILFTNEQVVLFNIQPKKVISLADKRIIDFEDLKASEQVWRYFFGFNRRKKHKQVTVNPDIVFQDIQKAYQKCQQLRDEVDGLQRDINFRLIGALGVEMQQSLNQS